MLSGQYVHIRNRLRESLAASNTGSSGIVVPITIRQLEAIIRLSESLAKMRLSPEATVQDVEEALRLFKVSTLAASQSNPLLSSMIHNTNVAGGVTGVSKDIQLAEDYLKRRIGIRVTVSTKKIIEEAQVQGYNIEMIRIAMRAMVMRNELQELHQGKILRRLK
jgi:DNA replication licensing factor MCM5